MEQRSDEASESGEHSEPHGTGTTVRAPESEERSQLRDAGTTARAQILVSACLGVGGGVLAGVLGAGRVAPLVGWDVLALVFCGWVWIGVWGLDAYDTRRHARREDPNRRLADLLLLGAALASLVAVGAVLFGVGHANGDAKYYQAGFALLSVFVSWALVHTVFMLKYARLFYNDPVGGIDFKQEAEARYSDFAYVAFTVGMTFQVSDTDIKDGDIRRAVLRQALMSFPLGTVIIAAAINLVAGLAK